ncbi:MAG TPA: J domain-containing protein [Kofleriaceae bacterium]
MASARTLHVRCATWEQVDVFLSRKLRKGRYLSMKVPFAAKLGSSVTLGLELPTEVVMAIDGIVQRASAMEGEGTRTWIEVELVGLTDEVQARIKSLAVAARAPTTPPSSGPKPPPPPRGKKSSTQPIEELPAGERDLFQHLSSELRRLRAAAVHEVLGIAREAGPDDVREAWRNLVRRFHPDLVARRGAPAISHLAEELTILANRAYDRLRTALVAEGHATAAGSRVQPPPGWLVGFEDLQSADRSPPVARPPSMPRTQTPPPIAAVMPAPASTGQGGEAFEQRARTMLAQGDANAAREVLAAALVVYPRSKPLRSLYYVASALAALGDGEVMLAQSQLETALAHYEQCIEAAQLLELLRKHGPSDREAMRRVFL